jgi:DNA-binding MarR family transcriptional regulator
MSRPTPLLNAAAPGQDRPAETQLTLAQAIRYDKTRLIGLLDELEHDGLITRTADPRDRRARVVALTEDGEARYAAARGAIQAMEDEFLADLKPAERTRFPGCRQAHRRDGLRSEPLRAPAPAPARLPATMPERHRRPPPIRERPASLDGGAAQPARR